WPPKPYTPDRAGFSTTSADATEVADSPFFAFLTFPLLSASFRWGWRGILWTSVGLVALYAVSSVVFWPTWLAAEFEPTRFGVHSAHVLAVGAMLALFSLQQRHFGDELIRLGTWPAATSTAEQPMSEALEYAAKVFAAPRAILVRSDALEPWVELADWSAGQAIIRRFPPGAIDPPVPEALAQFSFLAEGNVAFVHRGKGRLDVWQSREAPINEAIRRQCDFDAALCFPVRSEEVTGGLLIPGRRKVAAEDFITGDLVAARVVVAFEQATARNMLRDASAAEDRLRLSRDLHDGVLQALTGAALKLQAALHEHTVSPELRSRLSEVGPCSRQSNASFEASSHACVPGQRLWPQRPRWILAATWISWLARYGCNGGWLSCSRLNRRKLLFRAVWFISYATSYGRAPPMRRSMARHITSPFPRCLETMRSLSRPQMMVPVLLNKDASTLTNSGGAGSVHARCVSASQHLAANSRSDQVRADSASRWRSRCKTQEAEAHGPDPDCRRPSGRA
ncbi:histidine kinase, partial [Muricoccus vinaceus]